MCKAIPSYQSAIQNEIRDLSLGFALTSLIPFKLHCICICNVKGYLWNIHTFSRVTETPSKNKNLHKRKVSEIRWVLKR